VSWYQKKHLTTHTYRDHLLPPSTPCSISVPDSVVAKTLSMSSLLYLLVWHSGTLHFILSGGMHCWHGYVSMSRCRFAYGTSDVSVIPSWFSFLVLAHLGNPRQNPRGPLNSGMCMCVIILTSIHFFTQSLSLFATRAHTNAAYFSVVLRLSSNPCLCQLYLELYLLPHLTILISVH